MSHPINQLKRAVCGLLCLGAFAGLCGCGRSGESAQSGADESAASAAPLEFSAYRQVSVNDGGALEITRRAFADKPMGDDGTWTVFVYMSGSTLELADGKGTEDMDEMLAGAAGENVRFIVQTGGSVAWKNDYTPEDKLCRFEIANGRRTKLAELPLASMAEGTTLRDFLQWGVENYPAEKMGVVFWGHGKGSIDGVCRDNLHYMNYLSLADINAAFAETAEKMTDKFEFVGFDSCYMGTVEAADILASYARYMIGSEELEAASGWNYTRLGTLLVSDPHADWTEISKAICDGFFDDSDYYKDRATIAVIDLSKLDGILVTFSALVKAFGESADKNALDAFEARLDLADHFSDDSFMTGYSNTVDLGDLIRCMEQPDGDALLKALESAAVYKRMGRNHPNACGLTVFYPFELQGLAQLRTFSELAVSPYYLALIDKKQRAGSSVYDTGSHDPAELIRLWCGSINEGSAEIRSYWGGDPEKGDRADYKDQSVFVKAEAFSLNDDGTYGVKIAADALESVAGVSLRLYRQSEDKETKYLSLGERPLKGNRQTGEFGGVFDGKWVLYADGTPLCVNRRGFGADVYEAPVGAFGQETALRLTVSTDSAAPKAELAGIRRQENGVGSIIPPPQGETVDVMYPSATPSGYEYRTEKAGTYTFGGEPSLIYDTLPDGNYFYMLVITDIYNNTLRSDRLGFSLANGAMTAAAIVE